MRYFSSLKISNALCKGFSVLAFAAVLIGGFGSPIFTPEAKADHTVDGNGAINVSVSPSSGTLTAGQALQLNLTVGLDPNDTNPITSPSCLVNGVQVNSTFTNLSSGSNGHFRFTYTVGASDTDRAAGQIPINCSLQQTHTVTVSAFDDGNTVAIDAAGDNGSGNTATVPSFSNVNIQPSSGTLEAGMGATVNFIETDRQTDVTVTGTCMVNAVDVASSWSHAGNGSYTLSYIVGPNDGERPAGNIPFTCRLGNSAGNVTINGWSDGNTLAIDTNGDGNIDNGTSTLGFTVSADPNTGTLGVGAQLVVSMQNPLPSADVVIGPAGCRVNDVDVSGTYGHHGNGLYKVTYTVGATDANRPAGQIPFDCTLQNNTGSVHLTAFTDGNTVAVDTSATTTGNGGNNNNGTTTATTTDTHAELSFEVTTVAAGNMLHAGQQVEVFLDENNNNQKIELNGACTVNNVDVAGTFADLSGGLYKVVYTIGSNDAERQVNQLPINCALRDWFTGSTTVITSFGGNDTPAIDTNNDGTISATTTGGNNNNGGNDNGTTTATTTTGTIGGDVTGGDNDGNGFLQVTSIDQISDTAVAGGGYAQGWVWVFNITVPSDESSLQMKFDNWTHSNGSATISMANNMRISSQQASNTGTITMTAAGQYGSAMTVTGDLDTNTAGRQIQVRVEMQVPSGTTNGSYTTDYGVKTM